VQRSRLRVVAGDLWIVERAMIEEDAHPSSLKRQRRAAPATRLFDWKSGKTNSDGESRYLP
jgi:hypothetical protein